MLFRQLEGKKPKYTLCITDLALEEKEDFLTIEDYSLLKKLSKEQELNAGSCLLVDNYIYLGIENGYSDFQSGLWHLKDIVSEKGITQLYLAETIMLKKLNFKQLQKIIEKTFDGFPIEFILEER